METLPSNITSQIKNKAESYMHAEVKGMVGFEDISPSHLMYAYEAGATEYALRAQALADALEKIRKSVPDQSGFAKICDTALQSWNQKEGV